MRWTSPPIRLRYCLLVLIANLTRFLNHIRRSYRRWSNMNSKTKDSSHILRYSPLSWVRRDPVSRWGSSWEPCIWYLYCILWNFWPWSSPQAPKIEFRFLEYTTSNISMEFLSALSTKYSPQITACPSHWNTKTPNFTFVVSKGRGRGE